MLEGVKKKKGGKAPPTNITFQGKHSKNFHPQIKASTVFQTDYWLAYCVYNAF